MISRERCVVHVDGMLLSTRRGGDQSHVDSGKGWKTWFSIGRHKWKTS